MSEEKCGWVKITYTATTSEVQMLLRPALAMPYVPPKDPEHFAGGILKSGVYRVQNRHSKTYLDVLGNSNLLCFRQARELAPQDALVISVVLVLSSQTLIILRSGNSKGRG